MVNGRIQEDDLIRDEKDKAPRIGTLNMEVDIS
jgi:hypothetical protein